jgi:Fe-Mn family superoxide dismutase
MSEPLNRREMLRRSAAASGAALIGSGFLEAFLSPSSIAWAEDVKPTRAFPAEHQIKPLPFAPSKLKGLSEKLITSHHENNYGGAVKNLNKAEKEMAQITKDTPGFAAAGLGQSALTFRNSMILHELYFGNLGGNGKAQGKIEKGLSEAYGSF